MGREAKRRIHTSIPVFWWKGLEAAKDWCLWRARSECHRYISVQSGDFSKHQNILKYQVSATHSATGQQLDPTEPATPCYFHGETNSIGVINVSFVSDGVDISSAELTLDLVILKSFSNLNSMILWWDVWGLLNTVHAFFVVTCTFSEKEKFSCLRSLDAASDLNLFPSPQERQQSWKILTEHSCAVYSFTLALAGCSLNT